MDPSINRTASVLLLLAFSNSALHAAIPSHWLSFAVVGRANRWDTRRTLLVTALAGFGHMLMVVALGLTLARLGKLAEHVIPPRAEHIAAACVLILLGVCFLANAVRSGGHCHCDGDACHDQQRRGLRRVAAAPTVMGALVMGLTLSPCLELLSLYVAGSRASWHVLAEMSVIMAVTTVGLMVVLVWLTMQGLRQLKLQWLERHEGYVVGVVLVVLGCYLFFLK